MLGVACPRVVLQMAVQDQPAAVPLYGEIVPRLALGGGTEARRLLESQFAQFAFVRLAHPRLQFRYSRQARDAGML